MRRIAVAGGVALALTLAGGGVAFAAAGRAADPAGERQAEAAFTKAHQGQAAVTQQQAIDAATRLHPGTVTDVHLEDEGDGLRWEVKPDDGTSVWEVQVDAASGRVVSDQLDD